MSIFKETLDPGIQTQLRARTLVVSGINNNRSGLLPWYLSKNAWVRMTSFVNFTEGTVYLDGTGSILVDSTTGHYKNDQLSKKYVLEGGTLYNNQLRYGVATANGAYGSNIDFRPDNTADPKYFRQQGLRPMPGITDVRMRTIGAYGSLFETTVNFHAWDTNQLNELEILFMRPGYSVLLEWGWSQYIDYVDGKISETTPLTEADITHKVFSGQTINPFDEQLTQQAVYDKLEDLRKRYRYNYDGMLGYIKNFSWKLRKDGGYDCSTTLISMGEVINTIKLSTNANSLNDKLPSPNEESSYYYDDYENVLLSLKSIAENAGYTDPSTGNIFISESLYAGNWNVNTNYVGPGAIRTKLENAGYTEQAQYIGSQPLSTTLKNTTEEESSVGNYYEYLSLDVVVAIISSYANLKIKTKKQKPNEGNNFVEILVPTESDYCLAGKDTISALPNVCNVYNEGAFKEELKYFAFDNGYDAKTLGITPPLLKNTSYTPEYKIPNFYDDSIKSGRIKNIFVNIDFLLNTYKQLKSSNDESGVNITDYLKNILNGISNALGGLNNFILSTAGRNQNTLRIIDTYYLEQGRTNDKYQFDLLGLGSICKDVSIQSQIFQEQSTIVAIAAQSKANLGDVYNSTQVYLNAGLEDRLAITKFQGDEDKTSNILNADDKFYIKLARLMSYARKYIIGPENDSNGFRITSAVNSNGNDPHTILKQALLRYDGEMNFKALIPFKLRITLEGIGGIVVGQIFTVKQNILPKNYYDKNLGFIITQIEHVLKDNQWETVLDTQICILDQQNFYDTNGRSLLTSGIKREGFGDYIARAQASALLYPIFLDFLIYQATRSFIGYIYSAAGESWLGDNYTGMTTIKDTLISINKNKVDDYWKNNVSKFIGKTRPTSRVLYQPRNLNNFVINYPMTEDGFTLFCSDWAATWKLVNPTKVNEKFTPDGDTIGNLLDFISKAEYNSPIAKMPYKDFKKHRDAIVKTINDMSANVFYPSGTDSVYKGEDIRTIVDYVVDSRIVGGSGAGRTTFITYSVNGWKTQDLIRNFTEIMIKIGGSDINRIIENYTANTKILGLKPLKDYFMPNSDVMYGNLQSLVIPFPTTLGGGVLNSFAFSGTGGINKGRDTQWAKIIDWSGYEGSDAIKVESGIPIGDSEFFERGNKFFDEYTSTSTSRLP